MILSNSCNNTVLHHFRCRKLPKAMREWPAYVDLKKKIDDFNEMCPLLEMMANKAMKDRHWEKLSKLCQYFFDVESETFTLANVMQAPLLKYKDDVEVFLIRLSSIYIYFIK